jgi:hypothetical protein
MTANDKLYVEVLDDDHHHPCPAQLRGDVLQGYSFPQRLLQVPLGRRIDAPMTQAEFHGRAWNFANHKARELRLDCDQISGSPGVRETGASL